MIIAGLTVWLYYNQVCEKYTTNHKKNVETSAWTSWTTFFRQYRNDKKFSNRCNISSYIKQYFKIFAEPLFLIQLQQLKMQARETEHKVLEVVSLQNFNVK